MRIFAALLVAFTGLAVPAPCQESPDDAKRQRYIEQCSAAKDPRKFCEIHQRSFEVVEVPIGYGRPVGPIPTTGTLEYECRHLVEKERLFPHSTPRSVSGGCIVIDDEKTTIRCGCVECTEAERQWEKDYIRRSDVTPYRPHWLPGPDYELETELFLRIQELRAFGEEKVAECLQRAWDRSFGHE